MPEGVISGLLQDHRRCGGCGREVRPYKGDRKMDGWCWHRFCWLKFRVLKWFC